MFWPRLSQPHHIAPPGSAASPGPDGPSLLGVFRTGLSRDLPASPNMSDLPPSLEMLEPLFPKVPNEPVLVNGLVTAGRLSLRIRLRLRILSRSEITWPACGAATITVLGVASGGGSGESDLNRGCICDSLIESCWVKARCGGSSGARRDEGL